MHSWHTHTHTHTYDRGYQDLWEREKEKEREKFSKGQTLNKPSPFSLSVFLRLIYQTQITIFGQWSEYLSWQFQIFCCLILIISNRQRSKGHSSTVSATARGQYCKHRDLVKALSGVLDDATLGRSASQEAMASCQMLDHYQVSRLMGADESLPSFSCESAWMWIFSMPQLQYSLGKRMCTAQENVVNHFTTTTHFWVPVI